MTSRASLLLAGVLVAILVGCEAQTVLTTPPIENPARNGAKVTAAQVNLPTAGSGSTANGVSVDQVFGDQLHTSTLGDTPIKVGVDDNKPVLSGRKMLADVLPVSGSQVLSLTGSGVQAGADGAGVTSTLYGHGQGSGTIPGSTSDAHIQPHGDETTLTVAGKSVSGGAGVNPDQLAGEGEPLVYTTPGRK